MVARKCLTTALALCAVFSACDAPAPHSIESFQSPLGFRLKSATLPDVAEIVGPAEEFELPESHGGIGICYEAGRDGPIVVFMSDHEFGGTDKVLLGVSIREENSLDYPCSGSSYRGGDLLLGPLALAVRLDEMETLIAATEVRTYKNITTFFIKRRRELTKEEEARFAADFDSYEAPDGADTVLGIWGIFTDDQAESLGVWMEETY